MNTKVLKSCGRLAVRVTVLVAALVIGAGLVTGSALARGPERSATATATASATAAARAPTQLRFRTAVAAPCASQGSCGYCGIGGVWTGNCTRARLEYNVTWCGRHRRGLSGAGKAKCKAEAGYLGDGSPNQLLPWIDAICAPPNARTIYLIVKGLTEETGPVGVACAGISVYVGLHSLLFEIF